MFKNFLGACLLCALFLLFCTDAMAARGKNKPVSGQMVIQVNDHATLNQILDQVNGHVINHIEKTDTYLIGFSGTDSPDRMVKQVRGRIPVKFAGSNNTISIPEMDQISQEFPEEDPPVFIEGVQPEDFFAQAGIYDTGIDDANQIATGDGIKVAVIDNGIDYDHPMMDTTRIYAAKDFVDNDYYPSYEQGEYISHGTFVTTLIMMTAPDCDIIPIRAFDTDGLSDQFTIAQAIYWAIDSGASVINMSFGATIIDAVLQAAINAADQAGITMVGSAGNSGMEAYRYPAALPSVIAVNAVDTLEVLADFSNYGNHIDICAPGVRLYAGLAGEYDWGTWSGTSFSAPLVSGTVAMICDEFDTISPAGVAERLRVSARTDLLWGQVSAPDIMYGYGFLDAYMAVSGGDQGTSSAGYVYRPVIGDLNGSGTVTDEDARILLNSIYVVGEEQFTVSQADLNGDGTVNIVDVSALLKQIKDKNLYLDQD